MSHLPSTDVDPFLPLKRLSATLETDHAVRLTMYDDRIGAITKAQFPHRIGVIE